MQFRETIKHILFDLDGTLSDPKEGITNSIRYAQEKMGKKPLPDKDLLWCIGPPLSGSFEILFSNESDAESAIEFYRERFRTIGKFENNVYDGIEFVLETLKSRGFTLYVATSKPHVYAKEIVDYFKLTPYFKEIYGPELDGTLSNKVDLIAHILKKEGISPDESIMIGDRNYDIIGARENGLPSIGVTYGYGSRKELVEAGADRIVDSPGQLLSLF
jgi:phosphoglycolate phosphatase